MEAHAPEPAPRNRSKSRGAGATGSVLMGRSLLVPRRQCPRKLRRLLEASATVRAQSPQNQSQPKGRVDRRQRRYFHPSATTEAVKAEPPVERPAETPAAAEGSANVPALRLQDGQSGRPVSALTAATSVQGSEDASVQWTGGRLLTAGVLASMSGGSTVEALSTGRSFKEDIGRMLGEAIQPQLAQEASAPAPPPRPPPLPPQRAAEQLPEDAAVEPAKSAPSPAAALPPLVAAQQYKDASLAAAGERPATGSSQDFSEIRSVDCSIAAGGEFASRAASKLLHSILPPDVELARPISPSTACEVSRLSIAGSSTRTASLADQHAKLISSDLVGDATALGRKAAEGLRSVASYSRADADSVASAVAAEKAENIKDVIADALLEQLDLGALFTGSRPTSSCSRISAASSCNAEVKDIAVQLVGDNLPSVLFEGLEPSVASVSSLGGTLQTESLHAEAARQLVQASSSSPAKATRGVFPFDMSATPPPPSHLQSYVPVDSPTQASMSPVEKAESSVGGSSMMTAFEEVASLLSRDGLVATSALPVEDLEAIAASMNERSSLAKLLLKSLEAHAAESSSMATDVAAAAAPPAQAGLQSPQKQAGACPTVSLEDLAAVAASVEERSALAKLLVQPFQALRTSTESSILSLSPLQAAQPAAVPGDVSTPRSAPVVAASSSAGPLEDLAAIASRLGERAAVAKLLLQPLQDDAFAARRGRADSMVTSPMAESEATDYITLGKGVKTLDDDTAHNLSATIGDESTQLHSLSFNLSLGSLPTPSQATRDHDFSMDDLAASSRVASSLLVSRPISVVDDEAADFSAQVAATAISAASSFVDASRATSEASAAALLEASQLCSSVALKAIAAGDKASMQSEGDLPSDVTSFQAKGLLAEKVAEMRAELLTPPPPPQAVPSAVSLPPLAAAKQKKPSTPTGKISKDTSLPKIGKDVGPTEKIDKKAVTKADAAGTRLPAIAGQTGSKPLPGDPMLGESASPRVLPRLVEEKQAEPHQELEKREPPSEGGGERKKSVAAASLTDGSFEEEEAVRLSGIEAVEASLRAFQFAIDGAAAESERTHSLELEDSDAGLNVAALRAVEGALVAAREEGTTDIDLSTVVVDDDAMSDVGSLAMSQMMPPGSQEVSRKSEPEVLSSKATGLSTVPARATLLPPVPQEGASKSESALLVASSASDMSALRAAGGLVLEQLEKQPPEPSDTAVLASEVSHRGGVSDVSKLVPAAAGKERESLSSDVLASEHSALDSDAIVAVARIMPSDEHQRGTDAMSMTSVMTGYSNVPTAAALMPIKESADVRSSSASAVDAVEDAELTTLAGDMFQCDAGALQQLSSPTASMATDASHLCVEKGLARLAAQEAVVAAKLALAAEEEELERTALAQRLQKEQQKAADAAAAAAAAVAAAAAAAAAAARAKAIAVQAEVVKKAPPMDLSASASLAAQDSKLEDKMLAPRRPWSHQASVGSWLSRPRSAQVQSAPAAEVAPPVPSISSTSKVVLEEASQREPGPLVDVSKAAARPWSHQASVGSWLSRPRAAKIQQPALPEMEVQAPSSSSSSEVVGDEAPQRELAPLTDAGKAAARPWSHQASVGSWLSRPPSAKLQQMAVLEMATPLAALPSSSGTNKPARDEAPQEPPAPLADVSKDATRPWSHQASVGSWLSPCPRSAKIQQAAMAAMVAPVPSSSSASTPVQDKAPQEPPAPLADVSGDATRPWSHQASVGSWLSRPRSAKIQQAAMAAKAAPFPSSSSASKPVQDKAAATAPGSSKPAALSPFAGYYSEHVRCLSAPDWETLYARLRQPSEGGQAAAKAPEERLTETSPEPASLDVVATQPFAGKETGEDVEDLLAFLEELEEIEQEILDLRASNQSLRTEVWKLEVVGNPLANPNYVLANYNRPGSPGWRVSLRR
eukprot:TRINITY_DN10578_c0_g2_i1.p1 TRINITY_DN10578_c0_g2~~TRINITY_DN10578_c0_g2_i1.p1  ORF type:complete len:1912 (+),score=564.74 TRINITY_DN10578_c0_g2_i1:174-5909(+)